MRLLVLGLLLLAFRFVRATLRASPLRVGFRALPLGLGFRLWASCGFLPASRQACASASCLN